MSKNQDARAADVDALVNQVQTMVEQSGTAEKFDAAAWVKAWLAAPLPALAGATPSSYLGTVKGRQTLADLLASAQSGAYR